MLLQMDFTVVKKSLSKKKSKMIKKNYSIQKVVSLDSLLERSSRAFSVLFLVPSGYDVSFNCG